MTRARCRRRTAAGFTFIEMLVVLVVLLIAAALGFPALQNMIVRSKLEGIARETGMLVQQARFEAIKRSVPTVVRIDLDKRQVVAFADVNGAAIGDPPDGIFNPVAGQPRRGTDYIVGGTLQLPSRIEFQAPGGQAVIEGLTAVGGEKVLIFATDGSVSDDGAVRFADGRGNFLELRVEPRATARVELKKWDGSFWRAAGEGGVPWNWS